MYKNNGKWCASLWRVGLYGIEVYENTYNKHLNRLIIVNNKLLCILQQIPRDTPVVHFIQIFYHTHSSQTS